MSRLKRLLFEPDSQLWKNYKMRLLRANVRYNGIRLLIIIVISTTGLAYYYFQIKSSQIKELPKTYYMVPFHQIYQILHPIVYEWHQDAYLSSGSFEIFPDWGIHKEPQATLDFISPEGGHLLRFEIRKKYQKYDISILDFSYASSADTDTLILQGDNISTISDQITKSPNNTEILNLILQNVANDFIIENKFVYWPTLLEFSNASKTQDYFQPSWELCFEEAPHPMGDIYCFDELN